MKTLVKDKPVHGQPWMQGLRQIEKPIPEIENSNDVLIKISYAAICGTDVGIYNAKDSLRAEMSRAIVDPVTTGHEFSGRIVDAGARAKKKIAELLHDRTARNAEVKKIFKKDSAAVFSKRKDFLKVIENEFHASAEMHITCSGCYQCSLGEKHVCRKTIIKGIHDDGAFAEYVKVPVENLVIYHRKEIPLEIIAFMDAIGNASHTVLSVDIKKKNGIVLGCGVQGLMAVAVAKYAGAKNIYVTDASHGEMTHDKLEATRFAMARLYGAKDCFDTSIPEEQERLYSVIMQDTGDTGVDAAYEMSGHYGAYADAFRVLRMGGTLSLLGLPAGTLPVNFSKEVIFKGVTIKGIIGRKVFETWEQMELILKAGLAKKFLTNGFITHQFPMEKYDEAFAAIARGDAYKILLKP